jgi:hypothetical protein
MKKLHIGDQAVAVDAGGNIVASGEITGEHLVDGVKCFLFGRETTTYAHYQVQAIKQHEEGDVVVIQTGPHKGTGALVEAVNDTVTVMLPGGKTANFHPNDLS